MEASAAMMPQVVVHPAGDEERQAAALREHQTLGPEDHRSYCNALCFEAGWNAARLAAAEEVSDGH